LKEHLDNYPLEEALKKEYPSCDIVSISEVTQGQAITCSLGLKNVNEENSLLIAATDNGMIYDQDKYLALLNDAGVDAIVFTFRQHPSSKINPEMYGWVDVEANNSVRAVSVKKAISEDPFNDHAIVGTFYFRTVGFYNQALKRLLEKNIRVNGEFYVDSLVNELLEMDLKVKCFEVDDYICWGTPDDYETFVYWQSFFHKVSWHPYSLTKDPTVAPEAVDILDNKYRSFVQEHR